MSHELITLLIALGLVAIHVLSGKLTTIPEIPRSRWLSFSSAIPVAFVFLALLPRSPTTSSRSRRPSPAS